MIFSGTLYLWIRRILYENQWLTITTIYDQDVISLEANVTLI